MSAEGPATRNSITFRMTVVVCVCLLLFQAVLAVLTYFYFKRELTKTITNQQFTLLTVIAQNIEKKLLSSQQAIVDVARQITPEVLADSNNAQRFLDSRLKTLNLFDNGLFLFSVDGRIIAESPFVPNRRGSDISDRQYFKKTFATGQAIISDPFISTHTPGAPAVMFTAPVQGRDGKMVAILGGGLNLLHDNFLGELARTRIAKTGYIYVFTHGRALIMHPDKSRIMQHTEAPGVDKLFEAALEGFEGTGTNLNSRGIESLASFKHLNAAEWIIGADYPLAEAYEPIRSVQKYFLLISVAGAGLIIVVVRLLMVRFTSTLVRFAEHVRQMPSKQGQDRLFRHHSNDEIGILARTFNAMIRQEDRKSQQLLYASNHDALTGLFNRAWFDSELDRLSRGRISPVSVVVGDIDGLKVCNDTFGHAAGDALITAAAQALTESFRAEDVIARIGGDEFAILLPGVDTLQVELAVERVRAAVARQEVIPGACALSISLGHATCQQPEAIRTALKQADQAMYAEKTLRKRAIIGGAGI